MEEVTFTWRICSPRPTTWKACCTWCGRPSSLCVVNSKSNARGVCEPRPRQPMLWAAFAFATGVVLGKFAWRPPLWWLLAFLACLGFAGYLLRRRPQGALLLGMAALLVAGAFDIQVREPLNPSALEILSFTQPKEEVVVTAHVIREGTLRAAGFGGVRQVVDVETEEISRGGISSTIRAGLRIGFYGKGATDEHEEEDGSPNMRLFRYRERMRFPP